MIPGTTGAVGVVLRIALRAVLAILGVAGLYVGTSLALMLFPAGTQSASPENGQSPTDVEVFVITNGVHAELVFPIHGPGMDWSTLFPPRHFERAPDSTGYMGIGWGDREFYLHTPTWADLTVGRALGALLGRNSALLHVTHITTPSAIPGARRLRLSPGRYARLVRYVDRSLIRHDHAAAHLPGSGYGPRDTFYQARGSFSALNTCNSWVGRGLREAGVSMGPWTPLDFNVLWQLDPA